MDTAGGMVTGLTYDVNTAIGLPVAGPCTGIQYNVGVGYLGAVAAAETLTDISLVKTVSNADPLEGATIIYTIRCWNNGPGDSSGIQVTDLLPLGVTYQSHNTAGIYIPGTGVWQVGPVTASGLGILTITATVDGGTTGQTIVNTAAVTASDQTDPSPGNETDEASITVGFGVHYVDPNGSHESPFINWSTAATNIQAAVDVALADGAVWVSNGVYSLGGEALEEYSLTNRVYISQDILVRSVNGPEHTHIVGRADPISTNGPGAQRCAYIAGNARLEGFTLRDGHTHRYEFMSPLNDYWGGGVYFQGGGTLSNCVIRDCRSEESGGGVYTDSGGNLIDCLVVSNRTAGDGGGIYMSFGGGAYHCRILDNSAGAYGGGVAIDLDGELYTCLLAGNSAGSHGGGASLVDGGGLASCTVAGNHATGDGGGVHMLYDGYVVSTVLHGNTAGSQSSNWHDQAGVAHFEFTCTEPDPGGESNVMANPQFVDAAAGDYRLKSTSPCVDAGEPFALGTDLNGLPRPLDGDNNGSAIADIGAYECAHESVDSDGDGMGDGFEARHGLNLMDPGDASDNPDGDPHDNLRESIADTNPMDSNSYLRITGILPQAGGVDVQWQGGIRARQYVEARGELVSGDWTPIRTNEPPIPVRTNFVDTAGQSGRHYRIKAERP